MENVERYDLVVVGAGPAGTSAAITAAGNGARVLLLERGKFPRHKVCGEFVSAESLGLLASLLDSRHIALQRDAPRISRARFFVDGRKIETTVDPPAASIARLELDVALWESAAGRGVETAQQATVEQVNGDGPFYVSTSVGAYEARAVINASGRWSNLTAANGAAREKWVGVKAHFAERNSEPSVDLYFFDGGYCGVQPVDPATGRINACAMARADVATTLAEVFAQHPELQKRSEGWRPLSEPVSTSPLVFREPRPVYGGMLMAGDAAAFVDPFVGDGISLAIRSGVLAAECLASVFRGESSLEDAAHTYDHTYRERFVPVLRSSSRIRRALSLPKTIRRPFVFALEKAPSITRFLTNRTR